MYKYIVAGLFVLGCGAHVAEFEEKTQNVTKEVNFGVRSDNGYVCSSSHTGTCYYSEAGTWNVYFATNGLTQGETVLASSSLNDVINILNAGQYGSSKWAALEFFDGFDFARVSNASQAHIMIQKSTVPGVGGNGIAAYVSSSCTSHDPALTESPTALNGTHRFCNRWQGLVDIFDVLNSGWTLDRRDDVMRHAMAVILLRAAGVGLETNIAAWNGDNVPNAFDAGNPIGGWVGNNAACRADYFNPAGNTICVEAGCSFGIDNCF